MKKLLLLIPILLLSGCTTCTWEENQDERERLFIQCLELVPEGPRQTHYNDWAEVVDECDNVAYWQSKEEICKN